MERIKVLYNDITEEERRLLEDKLKSIKIKRFYNHALDRMKEKRITKQDVLKAFNNYDIIEVNYSYGTPPRVLIRSKETDYNNYCTCVVLRFDGTVITCYKNKKTDNHRTLNSKRYKNLYIKNLISLIIN